MSKIRELNSPAPYGEAAEAAEVRHYRSNGAARLTRGSALLLAAFDLVLHGLDNREYADAHALPRKENP